MVLDAKASGSVLVSHKATGICTQANEAQAVSLRSKLRLVEQARLFGAESLVADEEEAEVKQLVATASIGEGDALQAGNTATLTIPPSMGGLGPFNSAAGNPISSGYRAESSPGRIQNVSARSFVRIPDVAPVAPVPAGDSTPVSPAGNSAPIDVPASAVEGSKKVWSKLREPEAVGGLSLCEAAQSAHVGMSQGHR